MCIRDRRDISSHGLEEPGRSGTGKAPGRDEHSSLAYSGDGASDF